MTDANAVYAQNNGDVTKAYYAELDALGPMGKVATCLFRAQKRSTAAKRYRGRRFKGAAYDVKNWSMSELCRVLQAYPDIGFVWGWGRDLKTPDFTWVLYVDLPGIGQCSFHSAERGQGPDYPGEWDGQGGSEERILAFCNLVYRKEFKA